MKPDFTRHLLVILIAGVGGLAVNTGMGDVVFSLDNSGGALADGLGTGDVLTVDGVSLTFSSVVVADGSPQGAVEGTGILMSSTADPIDDVIQFDFSFSHDVVINSWVLGTHEDVPPGSFISVVGPNGTAGNNAIPAGTSLSNVSQPFDMGTIAFFQAGAVYSFTHNLPANGDPLFNLAQLSVSPIPEPGLAWPVLGAFLILVNGRSRRSRLPIGGR